MQVQMDRFADNLQTLSERVSRMETRQDENHKQNRGDIHRINNAQQDLLDALHEGLEKIADKVGGRMDVFQGQIITLRVQFARAIGYAAGMAAVCVVIIEVAKAIIERK